MNSRGGKSAGYWVLAPSQCRQPSQGSHPLELTFWQGCLFYCWMAFKYSKLFMLLKWNLFFQIYHSPSHPPTLILPSAVMNRLMFSVCGLRLFLDMGSKGPLWKTPNFPCMTHTETSKKREQSSMFYFGQWSSSFENSAMVPLVFSLWLLALLKYNAASLPPQFQKS